MSNIQIVVCLLLLVCFFACVGACMLDVQDYKEEFPNGDPNKGSEGNALIGGNAISGPTAHALR